MSEQQNQQQTATAEQPGYAFKIEGRPDYSFLTVTIPANETLKVEASAMATMDTHINMKTKMKGGLGRWVTGESLFINEFTAEGGPGEIGIAPGPPGDLSHVYLHNEVIFLQNSAYVASTLGVEIETKWQGLKKGFFSGENLFLIRCSGDGDLWFNTYGAIIEIEVNGDYVVDTGHIVAFTEGLDYEVTMLGGYKSLFFSGEGVVCRFNGKGKVWIQTRLVDAMVSWVYPFRRVQKKNTTTSS
ncbi:MAG: TIGR00266 family protein [Candidatus Parabeggiatoa sp. nov. 1]|nr:MAG: TIGR00266 family protein [Gammaproteobacteria bacterium]